MTGIDVAKWNVITDYSTVKKEGVQFAIVKVINASLKADGLFHTHIKGFKAAGIPCTMGYTYTYANTVEKAKSAAKAFVEIALGTGITFMWLDIEDVSMRGLAHTLVNIINIYKDTVTSKGLKFGIYTYSSFYDLYIKKYISELSGIPFWIARYPSQSEMSLTDKPTTTTLPAGIDIQGWQYTSKGKINGINGHVDLNQWYTAENEVIVTGVAITADENPFTEPSTNCKVGTIGNDANWCLWYLWRFGKLVDANGTPEKSKINNLYSDETEKLVKEVQKTLGLTSDGIIGKQTRAIFKKLA
jgi:GH25 family lysozyme M1 (1,4-beta-N-acetylmuramidase)